MSGGFQFFDIILFAMIAVFLILRLRSVLGRRDDGAKRRHVDPFARVPEKREGTVIPLPTRGEPNPTTIEGRAEPAPAPTAAPDTTDPTLAAGFDQIRQADRNFEPKGFAAGARQAFEMVLHAYGAGDTKTLRTLLSPDVFSQFEQAIRERTEAGQQLEATLVKIRTSEIIEAWMEARTAHVTVKFVTEQVHVVRDKAGEVVDGHPNAIIDVTDIWTFARDSRSRDPNWVLVATRSPV